MSELVEIDSPTATVIVDNEVDPMSAIAPNTVKVTRLLPHIALKSKVNVPERGGSTKEIRLEDVCCGHHGLSILLTATRGDVKHTILFDTGPEENNWEHNARALEADLSSVEVIQLSHWHCDHSGVMLRAIRMIEDAKEVEGIAENGLIVNLHPDRPDYRGLTVGEATFSLPADPPFEEIETARATVETSKDTHMILYNMYLISGGIPRLTPYENGFPNRVRHISSGNKWAKDELIMDEKFLMCNIKDKQIVFFTGCSHAGAVNTAKHAHKTLGSKVASSPKEDIQATMQALKEMDPRVLLSGHFPG